MKKNKDEVTGDNKEKAKGTDKFSMVLFIFGIFALLIFPSTSFAFFDETNAVVDGLINGVQSNLGRGVAILMIMGAGFAFYCSKISAKVGLGIVGGIILVFGAPSIADFFIGLVS